MQEVLETEGKHPYNIHLYQDFAKTLNSKKAFGESRHKAKLDGTDKEKIFSVRTMENYKRACMTFCQYVQAYERKNNLKQSRHMKQTKKYVDIFIQRLIDGDASANTISTYKSALAKAFGKDYCNIETPTRSRVLIKKNREHTKSLDHFSESKNARLVEFCKASGLRRKELAMVRPCDITINKSADQNDWARLTGKSGDFILINYSKRIEEGYWNEDHFIPVCSINVKQGKGGKPRECILFANDEMIEWIKSLPQDKPIFDSIPKNCPVHRYRRDYATNTINFFSRDAKKIKNKKDYYTCRKDLAGLTLDRQAMFIASKQLGHNRIDVIARNYLNDSKVVNYK